VPAQHDLSLGCLPVSLFQIWLYLAPPLVGTIIGYFTNDVAIQMLFRPYRALFVGKYQVPFTPGLIPRNQERLAKRISDTIMGSLLTPAELQRLAKRLLQVERVQAAIEWLLKLGLDQLQDDKEQRTAKVLAQILRDLAGESLPRMLRIWSRRPKFLEGQLNQIFDRVLLEFQLTEEQAQQISDWLVDGIVPPEVIRQATIDFLTDRNIQIIDNNIREKSSGTYWVVANLFGLRNTLMRLRTFCLDEKDAANKIIADLVIALGIRKILQEWFQNISLQNLPVSTVGQLRSTIIDSVRSYVRSKGIDLVDGLKETIDWEAVATLAIGRLRNSSALTASLPAVSGDLAVVIDRYLEKDLEKIVAQVIPILNIDQVIIDRVKSTSPEELELAIQGIVKTELQGIVTLGGVLGFVVGLLQTGVLYWQNTH
jgi:uncharacterized membrane protein YheB (UPF0754 family)